MLNDLRREKDKYSYTFTKVINFKKKNAARSRSILLWYWKFFPGIVTVYCCCCDVLLRVYTNKEPLNDHLR